MPEREQPKEKATKLDILNALSFHVWKRYFEIEEELSNLGKTLGNIGRFCVLMEQWEQEGVISSKIRMPEGKETKSRSG